jgi:predicted RNA-binding protein YlxR (DUF448 family)
VRTPERQCVGCGRRGPQDSFVRLSLREEIGVERVVVADSKRHSGRSAYLCRQQSCLERALARKAFQRAFRTSVEVDKEFLESKILTVKSEGPYGSECR